MHVHLLHGTHAFCAGWRQRRVSCLNMMVCGHEGQTLTTCGCISAHRGYRVLQPSLPDAMQGLEHSRKAAPSEASASCRSPPQPPTGGARVELSRPCSSTSRQSTDDAVNGGGWNQPVSPQLRAHGDACRLTTMCRWWAPPAESASQQVHRQACEDVLKQCLQQYRGGEPHTRNHNYVYRTGISYYP